MSFRGLQLTGGAVHLPKMFPLKSLPRLRDGSPSLDHSAERTVFQPLLPAASWTKKKKKKEKTEIARADPTGHVNLSRLQHRNNGLYLPGRSEDRVCAFAHMFKEHRVHQYADP